MALADDRYKIHELGTNNIYLWTVPEILERINSNRNEEWLAYDEVDWLEGWMEWEEGDTFHLIGKALEYEYRWLNQPDTKLKHLKDRC